jgi:hypothetical protein
MARHIGISLLVFAFDQFADEPDGFGDRALYLNAQTDSIIDPAHRDDTNRAARSMDKGDVLRQIVFNTVFIYGVRMAATYFHESIMATRFGQSCNVGCQISGEVSISKLVYKPHVHPPPSGGGSAECFKASISSVYA